MRNASNLPRSLSLFRRAVSSRSGGLRESARSARRVSHERCQKVSPQLAPMRTTWSRLSPSHPHTYTYHVSSSRVLWRRYIGPSALQATPADCADWTTNTYPHRSRLWTSPFSAGSLGAGEDRLCRNRKIYNSPLRLPSLPCGLPWGRGCQVISRMGCP
ncbi:hypothetical protein C8Q79DRAFT_693267 [Trametes meyenii]|nr:hypothetical protein C8Q79DRAFT_693267 [Trametes meyenii]